MRKLQKIKDQVARDNGYESWEDAAQYLTYSNYVASIEDDGMVDEVARRYAKAVAEDALKMAAESATVNQYQHDHGATVDKQSILSTPINLDL